MKNFFHALQNKINNIDRDIIIMVDWGKVSCQNEVITEIIKFMEHVRNEYFHER